MSYPDDPAPPAVATLRQWYHGRRDDLADQAGLAETVAHADRRWAGAPLRIDSQATRLASGSTIGIPVWQPCAWATEGALLLCLGDEEMLELRTADGIIRRCPSGIPVAVDPTHSVRFRPAARPQEAGLALVRPRAPGDPAPRARHCARVFQPDPALPRQPPTAAGADWSAEGDLHFRSEAATCGRFPATTWAEIAAEPSIHACPVAEALMTGGALMRRFIAALPPDWRQPGADVVVGAQRSELDPGWSPALLAWHLDGTSRANRRSDGRPDLRSPGRATDQLLACFGPTAPTRFLLGEVDLPDPPPAADPAITASVWHARLEAAADAGRLRRWTAEPDTMVAYGFGGFHATSRATVHGWRCLIKAMRGRGGETVHGPRPRGTISWPIGGPAWPNEPCGVFPDVPG